MLNSIFSGVFISLGGIVFIKSGLAPMFCVGIILCAMFADRLVTRVIPLTFRGKYGVRDCVNAYLGNFVGTVIAAVAASLTRIEGGDKRTAFVMKLKDIVEPKLSDTFLSLFVLAVGCGMLVAFGVYAYARLADSNRTLATALLALFITAFVYAGFEHIVADMFYLTVYVLNYGWHNAVWKILFAVTLGNAAGGLAAYVLTAGRKEDW